MSAPTPHDLSNDTPRSCVRCKMAVTQCRCRERSIRATQALKVCRRCKHYGTDEYDRTGCLKKKRPCKLLDDLYLGKGCEVGKFPPLFQITLTT